MSPDGERTCIYITGQGTLKASTIVLENTTPGNTHTLIYAEKAATIYLSDIEVIQTEELRCLKFVGQSTVEIQDSKLNCKVVGENISLKIENSIVDYDRSNVIHISDASNLKILDSTIKSSAPTESQWPAVWVDNSELDVKNTGVTQSEIDAAIYLKSRSKINLIDSEIPSLKQWDSKGCIKNTTVDSIIGLHDHSYLVAEDLVFIKGTWGKKINLYMGDRSVFIADKLHLDSVTNAVIRLKSHSHLYTNELVYVNGSVEQIKLEIDKSSKFINEASSSQNKKTVLEKESTLVDDIVPMEELQSLIGLKRVKETIDIMVTQVAANKKRVEQGLKPKKSSLNSVFVGNPGTGKTTVARLLGKILFQYGALQGNEFKFIEVSEADLISQNVGGTAIQTKQYLDQARGGVLFIDEAYTLNKKGASVNFGQEAIDTIMKYMEDHRDEIMVIFAGYTKEMDSFLKTNPGLVSRAPNRFEFEDYTTNEIIQLGELLLKKDEFVLEDAEYYSKQVTKAYKNTLDKSNGRWIRNFNESLEMIQQHRVVKTDADDVVTILNSDIDQFINKGVAEEVSEDKDALIKLNNLIGIEKVKQQVHEFIYQVEVDKQKEEMGMKIKDSTLHSLFLGNPGTGKTTVARIIGEVLYQKGVIATKKFIEVSRSDLVGRYQGHTATKTREVLESALGGVLFVDEAYTLYNGEHDTFGQEAINEILKFMEDRRKDIVLIFAGYTKEMREFLQTNSGLESRLPTSFDFEDYTPDEIVQIGLLGLSDYKIDEEFYAEVVKEKYHSSSDNSNARWVRNFNEKLNRVQSTRLIQSGDKDLANISREDIKKVGEEI
nr:AAA family ATPase [Streptococcus danieliae]